MFDVKKFLDDHQINWSDKGKNTQSGWVNITCPFCYDKTNHGGFNIADGYYNCWNCGHHFLDKVIAELLGCKPHIAKNIIKEYTVEKIRQKQENKKKSIRNIKLPGDELQEIHKNYLIKRNYNHEKLVHDWGLKGTNHIGNYKFRIIAPIYHKHKLISFQGRDVTDRQTLRYKACTKRKEVMNHKSTLYGIDNVHGNKIIICEGITDVWRLGYGSVCTFGTSVTLDQIRLITEFENVFILFDNEQTAQERANKLAENLSSFKINVEIIDLPEVADPSELKQSDADYLMASLLS